MAEVFGDPNRQYGIPGIDDQVPGSAAQQAGIDAYREEHDRSGDTGAASQAAVAAAASAGSTNVLTQWEAANGTANPSGAPKEVVQAGWLQGGAVDANWMVFNNIPGYQSTNSAIHYNMTAAEKAAFGPSYWAGSSLSPSLQALVDQARTGPEGAAAAAAALLSSVSQGTVSPAQGAAVGMTMVKSWAKANPVIAAIVGVIAFRAVMGRR